MQGLNEFINESTYKSLSYCEHVKVIVSYYSFQGYIDYFSHQFLKVEKT